MSYKKILWLFPLLTGSLNAQERFDFNDFVKYAHQNSGVMKIAEADIEKANSLEEEVLARRTIKGELTALGSVIPETTGNALSGETNKDRWGPLFDVSLKIYQPIYAFGASVTGLKGAKAGINAQRKLLEKEKWQLRYDIAELYYGYQLSFELLLLADDFESKIEKAYNTAKKKNKRTEADQINVYLQDIKSKKEEAQLRRNQIRSAMAWKIGMPEGSDPKWAHANLKISEVELKDVNYYLDLAKKFRPEWKALELENEARLYSYKAHRKLIWPVIFVGGKLDYATSPVSDDQDSPYANDPYNKFSAGIGVGAKWDLSFWEKNAKLSNLRADSLKAAAKESYFKRGILVEVEKDYYELKRLLDTEAMVKSALNSAENVVKDYNTAYQMKSTDIDTLKNSLITYGLKKKEYLEHVFDLDLAIVRLEKSVGQVIH